MKKTLIRNNIEFTVFENDGEMPKREPGHTFRQEDPAGPELIYDCPYAPGDKIIDLIVGTKTESIYYGGLDDYGRPMLLISGGILTCPCGMDVDRQTVSEVYAEYKKLDIYKITKANKAFFYEAASDMNEKADLYKLLGAKIETAYKYTRARPDGKNAF